jgi:hypothetical protein
MHHIIDARENIRVVKTFADPKEDHRRDEHADGRG